MALFMYAMQSVCVRCFSGSDEQKRARAYDGIPKKNATTHNTVRRFHMCVYVYVSSFVHQ